MQTAIHNQIIIIQSRNFNHLLMFHLLDFKQYFYRVNELKKVIFSMVFIAPLEACNVLIPAWNDFLEYQKIHKASKSFLSSFLHCLCK